MLTEGLNPKIRIHSMWIATRCSVAVAIAVAGALLAASPAGAADVTVCNQFRHPIFFAFAWEKGGQWISRGWSEVRPGQCRIDPFELSKVDVESFFFRGETNWIETGDGKKTRHQWGKGRNFAVQEKTFLFRDADRPRRDGRLAAFSPSLKGERGPVQLTITIQADGVNTTQSIKPIGAPPPSAPPPPRN